MTQEVRLQLTDPAALVRIATQMKEFKTSRWNPTESRWVYSVHKVWSLFVLPDLSLAVYTRKVAGNRDQGSYLGRVYLSERSVKKSKPSLTQLHLSIYSRFLEDSEDEVVEAFAQAGIKAVFKKKKEKS